MIIISNKIDLSDMKFYRLTVKSKAEDYISPNGATYAMWNCECQCGTLKIVRASHLLSGATKSCGCLGKDKMRDMRTTHGFSRDRDRLYRIWTLMRGRCNNKSSDHYKWYGERGVRVCDDWNDFLCFRDWALNNGYSESLTLDRVNVDGDYCPDNCRWATQKEQSNNTRRNHYLEYDGKTQTMKQWSEELCLNYDNLKYHINDCHWDTGRALGLSI